MDTMTAAEYIFAERRGKSIVGDVYKALREDFRVLTDPGARTELGEEELCHGLRSTWTSDNIRYMVWALLAIPTTIVKFT